MTNFFDQYLQQFGPLSGKLRDLQGRLRLAERAAASQQGCHQSYRDPPPPLLLSLHANPQRRNTPHDETTPPGNKLQHSVPVRTTASHRDYDRRATENANVRGKSPLRSENRWTRYSPPLGLRCGGSIPTHHGLCRRTDFVHPRGRSILKRCRTPLPLPR